MNLFCYRLYCTRRHLLSHKRIPEGGDLSSRQRLQDEPAEPAGGLMPTHDELAGRLMSVEVPLISVSDTPHDIALKRLQQSAARMRRELEQASHTGWDDALRVASDGA